MPDKVVIGDCELWHGDCREVLPRLPACDLILTDPPYGIGADKNLRANKQHGKAAAPSKDYGAGDWDSEPPPAWVIELMREKGKWQVFFGGNYYALPPARCWLVWDKDNGENDYADCELAWTNLPKAVRRLRWKWHGMLQQDMTNKEVREHPTQKPVPVMRWALMQVRDAATVCDPFMGSGTTGVACVMEGRRFVGIERERRYFDVACARIEQALREQPLLAPEPTTEPEQQGFDL